MKYDRYGCPVTSDPETAEEMRRNRERREIAQGLVALFRWLYSCPCCGKPRS